ncbi:hypothetical protein [Tannerella forsythia]|uniref:hypothetical protein n=1 Tax=Tannerella forsythia TaxID=28112 RepID=UPI00241FCD62|nr:hypothetical protein [Tannerella forsythia]
MAHGGVGDVGSAAGGGRVTDVGHGEASFGADAGHEIVGVGRQQIVVEIRFDGVPCFTHDCVLLLKSWLLRIRLHLRAAGIRRPREKLSFS